MGARSLAFGCARTGLAGELGLIQSGQLAGLVVFVLALSKSKVSSSKWLLLVSRQTFCCRANRALETMISVIVGRQR